MRSASTFIFATLTLCTVPAVAADPQQGRLLYETHCGGCHYEKLHERKATLIDSYAALREQVAKWAGETTRRFSPAELDDIAEYLNQSHYRLKR